MKEQIKKICTICKKEKLIEEFHRGTGKYGRRSMCSICTKERYDKPERLAKISANRTFKRQNDPVYRDRDRELTKANYRKNILRYLVKAARNRAKKRNIPFDITTEDLVLPEKCPLLNIELKMNEGRMKYNSYSIDKIDNSLGYIKGNVWIISTKANLLKGNSTIEELELLVINLKKKIQQIKE